MTGLDLAIHIIDVKDIALAKSEDDPVVRADFYGPESSIMHRIRMYQEGHYGPKKQ